MAPQKISMVLVTLALMVSFLFTVSAAQNGVFGSFFKTAAPKCDSIYGVKSGDNCLAIVQEFKLTSELFNSINPNLNCNALFVNQWLCVGGTA